MKKLLLSIALIGTVIMVSCSSEKKAENEGAALKAKIENCTNSDSLRIYVQQAKDYAEKLIKEGKDSAAEKFINEVTPAIKAKDPMAGAAMTGMSIEAKADSAFKATKESAKNLADSTSKAVSEKDADVKDAVGKAADNAKEKASDAVDAAKQKTADAAQKGADKVKELMGK